MHFRMQRQLLLCRLISGKITTADRCASIRPEHTSLTRGTISLHCSATHRYDTAGIIFNRPSVFCRLVAGDIRTIIDVQKSIAAQSRSTGTGTILTDRPVTWILDPPPADV